MDVSYSHIPKHAKLQEGNMDDPFVRLSSLAALTFPDGRKAAGLPMEARIPAKESGHKKLPDEHLACFDFLYYAAEVRVRFLVEFDPMPCTEIDILVLSRSKLSEITPQCGDSSERTLIGLLDLSPSLKPLSQQPLD